MSIHIYPWIYLLYLHLESPLINPVCIDISTAAFQRLSNYNTRDAKVDRHRNGRKLYYNAQKPKIKSWRQGFGCRTWATRAWLRRCPDGTETGLLLAWWSSSGSPRMGGNNHQHFLRRVCRDLFCLHFAFYALRRTAAYLHWYPDDDDMDRVYEVDRYLWIPLALFTVNKWSCRIQSPKKLLVDVFILDCNSLVNSLPN